MIEELLEEIAQNNKLRTVNTDLKLLTGVGAIVLCLVSASFVAPLFIAVVLSLSLLIIARIAPGDYLKIFIGPFIFTVTSVLVIILLTGGEGLLWSWSPASWLSLSVTIESLNLAFFVLCRVIGGMTGLIFISLTTPMTDLFVVMRRFRVPESVVDLAMIIYRTIFQIMDQLVITHQAQVMRLGYGSFRGSIAAVSNLCGSAFIVSWDSGEDLIRAMDARCYSGRFALLGEVRPIQLRPCLSAIAFLAVSSFVVIFTGYVVII